MTRSLLVVLALLSTPAAQGAAGRPRITAGASGDTAIFAAGCYWTSEAVFSHLRGVTDVVAGFAVPADPDSAMRSRGHTGYAEAARVVFDPSRISYEQLLEVFFQAAHDPTAVDRQGPDVGPQYRSVLFVRGDAQRRAAQAAIARLTARRAFAAPITTEIVAARSFGAAADQDFVARNPENPYVVQHDRPILAALRRRFPALYRD